MNMMKSENSKEKEDRELLLPKWAIPVFLDSDCDPGAFALGCS
jgi:hypothetical protein